MAIRAASFHHGWTMSHAYHRLLSRIERDYDVLREAVQVGERCFEFTRVAHPESLLDDIEETSAWQPYWGEAWASSIAAARWLDGQAVADLDVLDLGCGLGITGTVAAALGARVLMGDAARPALLFAQLNSWPWRDRVHVRQIDWRTDRLDAAFDLILGADILYDRNDFSYLDAFFRGHLRSGARVALVEPGRSSGDEFIAWARSRAWSVAVSALPAVADRTRLRLVELSRLEAVGRRREEGRVE